MDGSRMVRRRPAARPFASDAAKHYLNDKNDDDDEDSYTLESYAELHRERLNPYQPRMVAGHPIVSLDYAATWYPHVRARYNIHTRGLPCKKTSEVVAEMTLDPIYPEKFIEAIEGTSGDNRDGGKSGLQVFCSSTANYYHQDCIKPRPRHPVYDTMQVDETVKIIEERRTALSELRAARVMPSRPASPPPPAPPSFEQPLRFDNSLMSFIQEKAFVLPSSIQMKP